MKLHHILDDIFGSKSKVRILRLLSTYPEREFTEREIARHIDMSQNTVNKSLIDLKSTNALSYRGIGRANVYIINENSVLFPFLQDIFKDESRIREEVIKKLKNATKPFVSCIIFGSFAKGIERYDSDLDLIVITKNKTKAKQALDKLGEELLKKYGIYLSLVLLTPRELINKWDAPYMREARKSHLVIRGKTLGELYGKRNKN
jgi:predicted nucleotidyltransferase